MIRTEVEEAIAQLKTLIALNEKKVSELEKLIKIYGDGLAVFQTLPEKVFAA
jgi:hypothetical protein